MTRWLIITLFAVFFKVACRDDHMDWLIKSTIIQVSFLLLTHLRTDVKPVRKFFISFCSLYIAFNADGKCEAKC